MRLSFRRVLRFRLSTLLCLFVCFGLGFGWWKDHAKQEERIREAELIREMMRDAARSAPRQLGANGDGFEKFNQLLLYHISDAAGGLLALYDVGKETPISTLAQRLEETDVKVRLATVYRLGQRADASPLLQKALNDADPDVRMVALCALSDRSPATSIPAARAEMQKTVSPQAVFAAYAAFLGEPPERQLEPLHRLVELIEQGDVKTRRWAITALIELDAKDADASLPALIERTSDPDASIRRLALLAIGELADPASARHLMLRAYQAAEDDETRIAAASALSRLEVRASKE